VPPRDDLPSSLSTGPYRQRVTLSRRGILLGAGGVVAAGAVAGLAVDEEWLPGKYRIRRALGMTGAPGHIPDVSPGRVVSGSFASRHRLGAATGWSVVYPGARPRRLPVLVALHGLHCDHRTWIDVLGVDRFLVAAVRAGVPPFAIATVDGGSTYWHPRPSGDDAGAMVTDEFVPLLAQQGLDTSRLAFTGFSMGGYGALRLAGQLGPDRVRAVGALSAAIWQPGAGFSSSGFASQQEYDRFTVFGHQSDLDGIAVRVDCGREDPFYAADRAYVDGFDRPVTATFQDGAHDSAYWTRMMPAQLAFAGRRLQS
jgi:S-formylglutathione hydrolase FrmB